MARTALCAGLLALAVVPGLADPSVGAAETPGHSDWDAAATEAEKAAVDQVQEALATEPLGAEPLPRGSYDDPTTSAQAIPDAVLESVMKEVQNLFSGSLTVPGFETMDQASETVKHVVDRVRERMSTTTSEASRTTAALRGVTTDLLKDIMVQEAVIETLWAVMRDTQVRPWITNEHQALQTATTQAVSAYLSRMQDRMRFAGFSEEEIGKLLPRSRTCGREGPTGMFDTCPERNMGKRKHGGAARGYGYGYQPSYYPSYYPSYQSSYYPSYQSSYYPSYGQSYGHSAAYYPSYQREPYYGYSSYPYEYGGYGRRGYRRLGETDEAPSEAPMGSPVSGDRPTPAFPLTGFGPFSRSLLEETMEETPMEPFMEEREPELRNMGARGRGRRYGYYGRSYGSPYYSRAYSYGYPSYGYSSYGYPSYAYSYGYPSYSYGYPSYGYSSYGSYGHRHYPYSYHRHRYMRAIEVPEMEFGPEGPMTPGFEPTPITPNAGRGPHSPVPEPAPAHGSFRRTGDVRGPLGGPETPFSDPLLEPFEVGQGFFESVF